MTRLLLIGAAGVDWPGLTARLDAGGLPNLATLRARGVAGWLRAPPPLEGPAPWVGMVTGHPPEAHGVWRFDEAWAGGFRRVGRASWRVAPVWRRLSQAGVSTGSVGWPASRPGAGWDGDHIDRDFADPSARDREGWALPPHCAPAGLRDRLRDLRTHPAEITAEMLRPLVPDLGGLNQSRDANLPRLAVSMARAASMQAAAAWLLSERPPQALFAHHPWLAEVREGFDGRREGHFAGVVDGSWRLLDSFVGRLAELAGPETLVVVASPGWRNRPGAILAAGPGVTPRAAFEGADLADVAPTLLAAFGLEDAALPGRPLAALVAKGPLRAAPDCPAPETPATNEDLLAQAVAAGYAPPPVTPAGWRASRLTDLALSLLERDPRAAAAAADAALSHSPGFPGALAAKAMAHVALEEPEPLRATAEALMQAIPNLGWGPLAHAAFQVLDGRSSEAAASLRTAEQDSDPRVLSRVAAVWFAAGRADQAARVFRRLLDQDHGNAAAQVGLGMACAAQLDFRAAEAALFAALRIDPGRAAAYLQLAQVYATTGRRAEAARARAAAVRLGASPTQARDAEAGRLGA
jgi:tetratricopeptide (TPR) repeat protein